MHLQCCSVATAAGVTVIDTTKDHRLLVVAFGWHFTQWHSP